MTTESKTSDSRPRDHSEGNIRSGHDAQDNARLRKNPHDEDAKLDVALDESFPSSDAPSNTQPGKGKDPPPSSGFDEEAERLRERINATD